MEGEWGELRLQARQDDVEIEAACRGPAFETFTSDVQAVAHQARMQAPDVLLNSSRRCAQPCALFVHWVEGMRNDRIYFRLKKRS